MLSMEKAVRSGNLKRVQEFIQGGADVNARFQGIPLLSLAIKEGHNGVALELIAHGANVHAKDTRKGRTALHWACERGGREELVQRLISELQESSIDEEDSKHATPLSLVAAWCGVVPANYLLTAGANCGALSMRQKNVLYLRSCWEGDTFVARTLIANGCDMNARKEYGESAILLAVERGNEEVVKMLIQAGVKLDLQDLYGCTAMHYAALNKDIQCGVLLTEGGAKVGVKDKQSQTALSVASSEFEAAIKQAQSFTIPKIVCIVGKTGVGKSTLVAALQAERHSFLGKVFNRFKKATDHHKRTAGIEIIPYSSQRYGETLFYDYAGHHEYYGPHAAFLESIVCELGVPMALLVVVKATDDKETILDQLYYWLFPIAQMATRAASSPQIVIIGSFLDQVESKDEAAAKLLSCIDKTRQSLVSIFPLKFMGTCLLDCRQPQSEGINQLCHFLQKVPIPKLQAVHTQYSLAWVLSQIKLSFKDEPAVQLHTLAEWMQENSENLPTTIPSPEKVCKDLSATGHALYLPNREHCCEGWLVLDFTGILRNFHSTLISHPKDSVNKFGLLQNKELAQLFPSMRLEMAQQMLTMLGFCIPVDPTVLSEDVTKLTASNEDSGWLFFPTFVSAESPKVAVGGSGVCSLWWQLKTSRKQFISARVLQTILLHLAARFARWHDRADGARQHCCSFWRNGISWHSREGVDVTVYISNRVINVVAIGVSEETADKLCQYLTEVITDVISTVRQVSPNLKAEAYIVHRPKRMAVSCAEFVAMSPSCKELFPVSAIRKAIRDCDTHLLPVAAGDNRSSRVLVSDLFGGHTPSLEDMEMIFWTQRDQQLLAEIDAHLPVIHPPIVPAQVCHLSHPTFAFVPNPVVSWSLRLICHHYCTLHLHTRP